MNTRRAVLALSLSVVVVGCAGAPRPTPGPSTISAPPPTESSPLADPLKVVRSWTEARNDGDVEAAMSLLAERADVLGFEVRSPLHRDRLQALLEAQAIAEWVTDESDCEATEETVTCRYHTQDVAMRQWELALTGEHQYVVTDGKIVSVRRMHDIAAAERVLGALDAFRAWARQHHPDAERRIWSDPSNAAYATPEAARAFIDLLAQYEP